MCVPGRGREETGSHHHLNSKPQTSPSNTTLHCPKTKMNNKRGTTCQDNSENKSLQTVIMGHIQKIKQGWWDGSVSKGTYHQVWGPTFIGTHKAEGENWLALFANLHCITCYAHIHRQNKNAIKNLGSIQNENKGLMETSQLWKLNTVLRIRNANISHCILIYNSYRILCWGNSRAVTEYKHVGNYLNYERITKKMRKRKEMTLWNNNEGFLVVAALFVFII